MTDSADPGPPTRAALVELEHELRRLQRLDPRSVHGRDPRERLAQLRALLRATRQCLLLGAPPRNVLLAIAAQAVQWAAALDVEQP